MLYRYIYPTPVRAGCDIGSFFKWSIKGLNSEFSFSYISCYMKVKEASLPYYLLIAEKKIKMHTFPKGIRAM